MEFLPARGQAALPGYALDSSAGSLEGRNHEIPRSADRDPGPLVYWHRRICDAQAANYRRPCSGSSGERAAAIAQNRRGGHSTAATSSVHTVKLLSVFGPKLVLSATFATSRPRAISTRPIHGMLLRASKGVPLAREIGFEPGCEIHRRDREVRIIPANAGAIAEGFPGRPAGAGVFVAEGDVPVYVVADGRDAAPAERRLSEQRSGDLGEPVGLAISVTQEQYQGFFDRTDNLRKHAHARHPFWAR